MARKVFISGFQCGDLQLGSDRAEWVLAESEIRFFSEEQV
jgi:hypothetical protein